MIGEMPHTVLIILGRRRNFIDEALSKEMPWRRSSLAS
jgi:hypothetical protein